MDRTDTTLAWYARAVDVMKNRPRSNPTSWEYQAAIHGLDPWGQKQGFWDECQHQTWYFLPWHRGYLSWFEEIVQAAILEVGGPSGWALPYWNYSDVSNANARKLPRAFREEHADGQVNSLWVGERNAGVNEGNIIFLPKHVSVAALDLTQFEADEPAGTGSGGFGGPATNGFNHGGGQFGVLEKVPHGAVHVDIGGLMGDPATAALDPIFWLHHANIDRLWEIWRGTSDNRNPRSTRWLNLHFSLHDAAGEVVTFSAADMLETTTDPLSYRYDTLQDPRGAAAPPPAPPAPSDTAQRLTLLTERRPRTEMIGASQSSLQLGATPASTSVKIDEGVRARLGARATAIVPDAEARELDFRGDAEPRVFLSLENVVADGVASNYDVYLNLPEGADPARNAQNMIGVMATFGIARASSPNDAHGGGGLHMTFDITDVIRRQSSTAAFDPANLRLTFVPSGGTPPRVPVSVGRISLYHTP